MRWFVASTLLSALLLQGCASTISAYAERSTRKESIVAYGLHPPPVSGVSLAATRREIISAQRGGGYYTCSEPAPDAAAALALQSAFSVGTKASGNDQAAVTALALAQPTEIVEFWRTTSYNYCLLKMNGDEVGAAAYLTSAEKFISVLGAKKADATKPESKPSSAQATKPKRIVEITIPDDATVTSK